MAVDREAFLQWASERFGKSNIKIKTTSHGEEICTHSPWSEARIGKTDVKYHLWMNVTGGKSKHPEKGSYRCWLTNEMGSLVSLVSKLENIDHDEAEEIICGSNSLRSLEAKLDEVFAKFSGYDDVEEDEAEPVVPPQELQLPDFSYLIDAMPPSSLMRIRARKYLASRKIPTKGLYMCTAGDRKDRIVIPYYDKQGKLVFYNSRAISDKAKLRYWKCDTNEFLRLENLLYMTSWPEKGESVYITEGEFDAMSLAVCGYNGCACGGVYLSDVQIELLRGLNPVLCFDSDGAGREALPNIGMQLIERGFNVRYVRPPKGFKDWNQLLVQRDEQTIQGYIQRCIKPFTDATPAFLRSLTL